MRALACLLLAAAMPAIPQVKVWEGTLTLPTYQEGLPDPNPPFDIFATSRFNYPYTVRDKLTDRRIDQHWRALYLENEYLKCSVLPDIGGHLYSCTDKVNGKEMFYANPSIKKALIGYRGAWAAFGIEFNFPVSHNWASMSPVDFATVKHPDGSASVWVANIDRPYGMQWRVELILRPGSTVLEQNVRLYNRADVRRRFYWWNNAGVEVKDDSRVIYPMRFTAAHGFADVDTWPVDRTGQDISIIKNQTHGNVSRFVHASREPYMGVWHPATNSGVVHFAYWQELPGKKIWSWGADRGGREWRKVLSDNNSAYVEVQGGLFRNQETYAFLPPQETLQFREYWMPVRDIGGFSRANLDALVNVERGAPAGGRVTVNVGMNVTHAVEGTVRIKDKDRVVAEERVNLTPRDTWRKTLADLPAGSRYTVELRNAAGRVLMAHTENQYDWDPASEVKTGPQQAKRYPAPEKRSEGEFAEVGADDELNGRLIVAYENYRRGLERFPESFELSKAAGRLAVTLNRFAEAVEPLKKAQRLVTNDPEIHYYLGCAYNALGEARKARGEWERALTFRSLRPASALQLARLDAREGDRGAALREIREVVGEFPDMVRAGGMEVALLRQAKQVEAAHTRLAYWLDKDPTSPMLRVERVALGASDEALWRHLAADPERVLEIATDYMELGFWADAAALLGRKYPAVDAATTEPGAVLPQDHPMVAYYRAWCREKMGQAAQPDYAAAGKLSTRYIFPYRAGAFTVLKRALEVSPQDATAHYFLGDLYEAGGMIDPALAEWQAARAINPKIPVLHRNLAVTLMLVKNSPEQALEVYREGLAADPTNLEVYTGINQAMSLLGRPAAERAAALERYPDKANMPANLVYALALALAEDGRAAEAEKLFAGRFFPREEGGLDARQVQFEVALRKALTERKGAGALANDPFAQSARAQYYLGEAESLAGNQEAARGHWQQALKTGRGPWEQVFAYKAAEKLGEGAAWREKLAGALDRMRPETDESRNPGMQAYARGLMLQALGRESEADAAFRRALTAPDRLLSHYYTRMAMTLR